MEDVVGYAPENPFWDHGDRFHLSQISLEIADMSERAGKKGNFPPCERSSVKENFFPGLYALFILLNKSLLRFLLLKVSSRPSFCRGTYAFLCKMGRRCYFKAASLVSCYFFLRVTPPSPIPHPHSPSPPKAIRR